MNIPNDKLRKEALAILIKEFDDVDAHKMVTNLTCPNCATFVLVYTPKSHFEE